MNTEVLFYCTHYKHGTFYKSTFQKIVEGKVNITQINDDEWSEICYIFNLEVVFDTIIISTNFTEESVSDTQLLLEIEGTLLFEDNEEYKSLIHKAELYDTYTSLNITQCENKEENKVQENKTYESVWIDPYGETFIVSFGGHDDFAKTFLKQYYEDLCKEEDKEYYEILEDLNWIRILGWCTPPQFILPYMVNRSQKNALKDYCLINDIPYDEFPDILKS